MQLAKWRLGLIMLGGCIPLFSFVRYMPSADWYGSATGMLVMSTTFLLMVLSRQSGVIRPVHAAMLLLILVLAMTGGPDMPLVILVLSFLFLLSTVWCQLHEQLGSEAVVLTMAVVILVASMLQALLGLLQILGIAPLLHGWVLFDSVNPTGNIMGNIGQRNQYAQFLMWGVIAACYLNARGMLRAVFFYISMALLVLLMAWSGARLVLAYGLGLALLSWIWYSRVRQDERVKKFLLAILLAVIVVAVVQILNKEIVDLLRWFGLNVSAESGSDRMLSAGFGARRRIEWTKAWDVFFKHPLLGVGLGGYAHQSTIMELTAGLPKAPESWLFTQSHNLLFQMLAETGFLGAVVLLITFLFGLCPYFKYENRNSENLFLISIAMVLLVHSIFEYPLWYLSFLTMMTIILVMSPSVAYSDLIRGKFWGFLYSIALIVAVLVFVVGHVNYWILVGVNQPSGNVVENKARIERLMKISYDPIWRYEAENTLANYLVASKKDLDFKLDIFSHLAAYRPYPDILVKLAIMQALDAKPKLAEDTLKIAIANYPDMLDGFVRRLQEARSPEIAPLLNIALNANNELKAHGLGSDQGRIAAVMTVAAPVTRKPLFTF